MNQEKFRDPKIALIVKGLKKKLGHHLERLECTGVYFVGCAELNEDIGNYNDLVKMIERLDSRIIEKLKRIGTDRMCTEYIPGMKEE